MRIRLIYIDLGASLALPVWLVGWLVGRWNSANLCRGSTCHRISRLDEKFIAVSSDDNDRKIYALVNLSTP